jgi:hypothetical protein
VGSDNYDVFKTFKYLSKEVSGIERGIEFEDHGYVVRLKLVLCSLTLEIALMPICTGYCSRFGIRE